MLIVLTNSKDATADYLCSIFCSSNINFFRINTDIDFFLFSVSFTLGATPKLIFKNCIIDAAEISHVWYRRPKSYFTNKDELTPEQEHAYSEKLEALEGFFAHIPQCKWMNHPSLNVLASRKIEQLSRAKEIGLLVPETILTQSVHELKTFQNKYDKIITKPICSGFIERNHFGNDTQIYTNPIEKDMDFSLIEKCPTLFQEKINKVIDVRITYVNNVLIATSLKYKNSYEQILDIRRDNMQNVEYAEIVIPPLIKNKLIKFVNSYQLRFSAIDMVVDTADRWFFLENNPNGQWAWLDIFGGANISQCFIKAFST